MRKIQVWAIIFLCTAVLAACGINREDKSGVKAAKMVHVQLDVPNKANAGSSINLKASVTQGNQTVKDADEVMFEIWKEGGKKNSSMIDARNQHNGTYTAQVKLQDPGKYEVQVHVTARDMHVMPKKKIIVEQAK
nr:FixH family protein [Heyndrickxia acidiproducens]